MMGHRYTTGHGGISIEPPLNPPEPEVATFVCEGCGDDVAWDDDLPSLGKRLWCSWQCYLDTDGRELAPELREGLAKYLARNP